MKGATACAIIETLYSPFACAVQGPSHNYKRCLRPSVLPPRLDLDLCEVHNSYNKRSDAIWFVGRCEINRENPVHEVVKV